MIFTAAPAAATADGSDEVCFVFRLCLDLHRLNRSDVGSQIDTDAYNAEMQRIAELSSARDALLSDVASLKRAVEASFHATLVDSEAVSCIVIEL